MTALTAGQSGKTTASAVVKISRRLARHWAVCDAPVKRFMILQGKDAYRVLVCTVLSARTRDQVTLPAAAALLEAAPDPAALRALSAASIERIVKPCGFYRAKAARLYELARILGECHADRVPDRMVDLLALPGVGRKTANLVLALGYGRPALSVDVHVHRISNRLGLVTTSAPAQTELALGALLPRRLWRQWNPRLVALGQTVCLPRNPRCPLCPVNPFCRYARVNRRICRGGLRPRSGERAGH